MGHRALARNVVGWVLFGLGLWTVACEGGQTGEGPPKTGDDGCEDVIVEIDLDDDAALGFAPRRMLELASGPHTEPLHWRDDPELVFGPEQGIGSVTFEVTPTGARPRLVVWQVNEGARSDDCGSEHIEIDVLLSVQSAGGALSETVPVTLVASDPHVVRFDASLDPEMLGGTFALEESSLGGGTLVDLPLRGAFSQYGVSGTLETHIRTSRGNTGAEEMGFIATWPSEELCNRGFTPTVLRDAGEASIQVGLDLLAAASGLVLRSWDDQIVAVELGAMDDGGPACLESVIGIHPPGSVVTEVVLTVTSEDGAIDHDFLGRLGVVAASDGSLGEVTIVAACGEYLTDEFPGRCGDWGGHLARYDRLSVHAEISIRPPTDAPEIDGTFTVTGVPVCTGDDYPCASDLFDIWVVEFEGQ
jgi:hypothetical protein